MAKDGFDLVIDLGVSGRSVIRYLTDPGMLCVRWIPALSRRVWMPCVPTSLR